MTEPEVTAHVHLWHHRHTPTTACTKPVHVCPSAEPAGIDVERLRVAAETIGRVDIDDTEAGWRLYAEDLAHEYGRVGVPLVEADRPSEAEARSAGQRRRWSTALPTQASDSPEKPT